MEQSNIAPLYLHRRKDLTRQDLLEIYHSLNQYVWDNRLGHMPKDYHASRANEYRISCTIMTEIEWLVSKREARMYKYRLLAPSLTEAEMDARYTEILEAELPQSVGQYLAGSSYYQLAQKRSGETPRGSFGL